MSVDYAHIPTSALVALGGLILKRAQLSFPCASREQAIAVIRGIRPAPPRKSQVHIKPKYELCCICYAPMITGTPVDILGKRHAYCEVKI